MASTHQNMVGDFFLFFFFADEAVSDASYSDPVPSYFVISGRYLTLRYTVTESIPAALILAILRITSTGNNSFSQKGARSLSGLNVHIFHLQESKFMKSFKVIKI